MAANRIESPTAAPAAAAAPAAGGAAAAAPAAAKSGLMAWMPVIANLVLMPALAYVTTVYFIAPKLNPAAPVEEDAEGGAAGGGKEHAKPAAKEHGKAAPKESSKEHGKASSHGDSKGGKGAKVSVPLNKSILVNVMGSMGTRYLLGNFTLVGTGADFEGKVKDNDAQLRDAAAGVMSSKTLQDLEKPGARNLVRTELITVFNTILNGKVQDIFMTEFAVQ